jgi:hypothetical protein
VILTVDEEKQQAKRFDLSGFWMKMQCKAPKLAEVAQMYL